jgi:hypothetical protein
MKKQVTQVQKNKIMTNKLKYFTLVHYKEDEIRHSQHDDDGRFLACEDCGKVRV